MKTKKTRHLKLKTTCLGIYLHEIRNGKVHLNTEDFFIKKTL